MRKERFIRNLTIVTVTVLAGIITLQVYWLITSYRQQKSRFRTDIQNALASANVKISFKKALNIKSNELLNALDLDALNKGIESSDTDALNNVKDKKNRIFAFPLSDDALQITDTVKLLKYIRRKVDTTRVDPRAVAKEITESDFKMYKAAYAKELLSREIYIPYELAIVSDSGYIYRASCDSTKFRGIEFKSSVDELARPQKNISYGLQAAFPNANIYLFRKMVWILSVTILLIVIGSCSLGYLLVFFFNQKKLSDLRNDFMNNMTHELKTPISSVGVALEMVVNESKQLDANKKTSYLRIAQKELKRLDILTESILKILSVERAEIKIVKSAISILPWLHNIADNLSPLTEDRSASIRIRVLPENAEVFADKLHMTNVMYNIIENAVKYNNKAKPEIQISVQKKEDHVMIEVSDNGEGIPSQYLKNVFDKFFRVPKGDRHDVKGYGLGLSYVKGIVEMHSGSIEVSSIADKGSTFTIQLPLN
jgi:signal transduction histidine kinase